MGAVELSQSWVKVNEDKDKEAGVILTLFTRQWPFLSLSFFSSPFLFLMVAPWFTL